MNASSAAKSAYRQIWKYAFLPWALGLLIGSYLVRSPQLGPSSLWLDDAWLSLGARLPWSDITTVGLTAPGFAGLIKISGSLFGHSSLAFQAIPFFFGVIMAPATFLALRRHSPGLVSAATSLLVVWAPVHVVYSARVKQYTLEGVLGLLLLYLAIELLDELHDRRRWAILSALSVVSIVMSTSLIVIVVAWCAAAGIGVLVNSRRRELLQLAFPWLAALGVFTLGYWAVMIRPAVGEQVHDFWSGRYLPTDEGLGGLGAQLRILLSLLTDQMFNLRPIKAVQLVVLASAVVLAVRRPLVSVLLIMPLLVTFFLALAEMAPLGGGRTDSHLLPAFLLMIGLAAGELFPAVEARWAPITVVAQLVLLIAVGFWAYTDRVPEPVYPVQDVRTITEELNQRRTPEDWVLVYYSSAWAYGLYTSSEVVVQPDDPQLDFAIYQPGYLDPGHVLMGQRRTNPEEYKIWVDEVTAARERVWFLSSHLFGDEQPRIEQLLRESQYRLVEVIPVTGAQLELWVPETQ